MIASLRACLGGVRQRAQHKDAADAVFREYFIIMSRLHSIDSCSHQLMLKRRVPIRATERSDAGGPMVPRFNLASKLPTRRCANAPETTAMSPLTLAVRDTA